jgi:PAS domain S-box-containing protein
MTASNERSVNITDDAAYIQYLETRIVSLEANQSPDWYQQMFEANPTAQLLIQPEAWAIVDANPAAASFYDLTRKQLCEMSAADLKGHDPQAMLELLQKLFASAQAGQAQVQLPCQHTQTNGDRRYLSVSPAMIEQDGGQLLYLVLHDMTAQRQIEENLRRNEAIFHEVERMVKVGGWEVDIETMQPIWTPGTYEIHGFDPDDALQIERSIKQYSPDDQAVITQAFQNTIETGGSYDLQLQFINAGGDPMWIRTVGRPLIEDGKVVKVYGTFQDITHQKRVEQALRESQELYQNIVQSQTELVCRYTPDTRITFVNEAYCRYYGVTEAEVIGQSFFNTAAVENHGYLRTHIQKLLKTRRPKVHEIWVRHPQKHYRYQQWTDQVITDASGDVIEIQAVGRDITERKHIEQALQRSESLYRKLVENLPNAAVMIYDEDLRYLLVGGKLIAVFGFDPAEIMGKTLHEVAPQWADSVEIYYRAALRGEANQIEFEAMDGMLDVQFIPLKFGQQAVGMVLMVDVTERNQQQAQAFKLAVERERINVLSKFIQNASHEFRTPLSTINSSTYLLSRLTDADKERRDEKLALITGQVERLNHLVDMLAKMTMLESEPALTFRVNDLNQIVADILNKRHDALQRADLTLHKQLSSSLIKLPLIVSEIAQAFDYIIDNAIRYNVPDGDIFVETALVDADAQVIIRDTGQGMSESERVHAFERFYRLDNAHTTPGFGLGLAIAQKIVLLHNGTIELESQPGVGTTVTVTLPLG